MKRTLLFCLSMAVVSVVYGQVKWPQVRMLENKGWMVQHSVMSWDSLSIYFSAKAPGMSSYDLYRMAVESWQWGKPERIDALSTESDECWPAVSSDQQMLFYVVTNPQTPNNSQIWRAWYRNGQWTEAAPLIISSTEDSQPQLLEDNETLLFKQREQTKKHDGEWKPFVSTMLDDHNWTIPVAVEKEPAPKPILAVHGTIVMQKSKRPLSTGKVYIYDAMKEQLLQTVSVHPMTGRWRAALQRNRHYRLAMTADGYSYYYTDIVTDTLSVRSERALETVALEDRLELTLSTYDAETQTILSKRKEVLPLGKTYPLTLSHEGYNDASLEVNTERPMVFTTSELDIPLQPQKSVHRFVVLDKTTEEPVENPYLRLNGQPAPADTTLRLQQEMTLQVTAPGYLFFDTLFQSGTTQDEHLLTVYLQPLKKDLVLQLRNIQFEYDSYELTESSNDELESVAQLLFMNPTLRIELSAHTDDQGSDRYNDRLSTLRGKAVEAWLQARGIDPSRMETVGYGKRKPLVANDSEEHRAINRRVEIKVLDY